MAGDDLRPKRVEALVGQVVIGPFARGSKSEREAIFLETGSDRLLLRRKRGPSYGDEALARYVGKRVRCDGFVVGYQLLAERIEVIDPGGS